MLSFPLALRHFSSQPAFLPQILHNAGRCRLPKGVVGVTGQDASKFLNGLCTKNILNWSTTTAGPTGIFAGFLNAHVASFSITNHRLGTTVIRVFYSKD